jgi:hypothetical protein
MARVKGRRGDDAIFVARLVDAVALLGDVVFPVFFEVAVFTQGPELKDGLGTIKSPACAGDVKAIFNEGFARPPRLHQ